MADLVHAWRSYSSRGRGALGASFSLVTNGAIPFALALVPPDKAD